MAEAQDERRPGRQGDELPADDAFAEPPGADEAETPDAPARKSKQPRIRVKPTPRLKARKRAL